MCAQQVPVAFPDNPRFAVQRLSDQFGLDAVTVTCLGQDRQGFLWIGTQTGLYRYDGARARKMTNVENIIGHYVMDMLIAPDGTPWFAGNNGIAHYRGEQFERVPIPSSAMPLSSGNQIFAVNSRGIVYVELFRKGILRVDPANPGTAKTLGGSDDTLENPAAIVRGSDDSIWFTAHGHLGHLDSDSDAIQMLADMEVPDERIIALTFDGAEGLWLRTATKLLRVDPRLHKMTLEPAVTGTTNEEAGRPSVDQHGRLLVNSSDGLYWQQESGWKLITDKQGLSSNDIEASLEDREGTIWVGGSGTGLDRLPGVHEWTAWTTTEGLPDNSTWSTLRDKRGRLWVSTARGIGIWDPARHHWLRLPVAPNRSGMEIRQIQMGGDGAIWAISPTGAVTRTNPDTLETSTYPTFNGHTFNTIMAAPDGSIWATTRSGLVRFEVHGGVATPTKVAEQPTAEGQVEYLTFSPNGVVWGTGHGMVCRFDGKNWQTMGVKDGLQGQIITSITALGDNDAWVAYNDVVGATHIRIDANGSVNMEHRSWDWSILGHDSQNRVWFNGTDGLAILTKDGRLIRKNHSNGLIWDDISPWSGVREEPDGSFMIATSRGLAHFQEVPVEEQTPAPNVVLTSVALGGVERSVHETIEVPSADASLAVQFTPLVLDNTNRVSCRYQLEGLEKHPTETTLREVRYGALPANKYRFWVECGPADGPSPVSRASLQFTVLPVFWQTWWARASAGVAGLILLWVLVWYRTRSESNRRRELEHAVAQRNAELTQKNKELEEISLTDPLTCTRNRRYFYETISTDIAQALRSHLRSSDPEVPAPPAQELIFALVDIDRFKRVNDELGHAAGDRLLQEVAKRIASVMRRSDDLVRWGGEEFLLVCRTTDRENAGLLCNRVLEAVRSLPFDVGNGVQVHKTCSIGWAPFPWLKDDIALLSIDNVIELADKALYLAKREGRNRSFGMVPAENVYKSERSVSIESLRDCPPDLVQIV